MARSILGALSEVATFLEAAVPYTIVESNGACRSVWSHVLKCRMGNGDAMAVGLDNKCKVLRTHFVIWKRCGDM